MRGLGTTGQPIWLGFDLGTQGVRSVAVSESGKVLAAASQPMTSQRNGPRHEQNPEDWWSALTQVSSAVLTGLRSPSIRGLAVDGTSGTILLIDRAGKALSAGLMYDDCRAAQESEHANHAGAELWECLGYRMQPSWALPKLLWWLSRNRHLSPGAHLAHQVDFINRRLAGCALPSDCSNALKSGYDTVCERWPMELFRRLGVPEHVLPPVTRSGTQIGEVCAQAAAATGIPVGTPIVAGMTDGCAAQVAAGALAPGSWNSVLGTTLVLKGVSQNLIRDPGGVLYSHRSPEGNWLPGGASNTGAAVFSQRFAGRDLDQLTAQAAKAGSPNLVAYPLAFRGERFPFVAPEAEGFVLRSPGGSPSFASEPDLFRALLEGVGFIERLCFDYLHLLGAPADGPLHLTGGGTRNRYWNQLRADILGRSVCLPENPEPAFGMAVLAASKGQKLTEVAKQMVRVREVIEPRHHRTSGLYERYLWLVEELERRGWLQSCLAEHARRRAAKAA